MLQVLYMSKFIQIYSLYVDSGIIYRSIHTKRATARYAQRSNKAEPLGKGWMRGRVCRHRACRRESVRTGGKQRIWEKQRENLV